MSQSTWLVDHLDAAWPEVRRRVLAGLHALGARSEVAEDALQEAAARLWRAQPDVDSIDSLTRWTLTVARRVIIDDARRRLVTGPLSDEAALADTTSVESSAMARVEVSRVARALRSLRVPDQHALLSVVDNDSAPVDRREAVRLAVRVHRARARLVEKVQWVGGIVVVTGRRLRSAASLAPSGVTPAFTVAAAAAAVGVGVVALSPWIRVPGGDDIAGAAPRTWAIDAAVIAATAPSDVHVPVGTSVVAGAPTDHVPAVSASAPPPAPPPALAPPPAPDTSGTQHVPISPPLEGDGGSGDPAKGARCTTCVRENAADVTPTEVVVDALPPGSMGSCTCDPGDRVPGPRVSLGDVLATGSTSPSHEVVGEVRDLRDNVTDDDAADDDAVAPPVEPDGTRPAELLR